MSGTVGLRTYGAKLRSSLISIISATKFSTCKLYFLKYLFYGDCSSKELPVFRYEILSYQEGFTLFAVHVNLMQGI